MGIFLGNGYGIWKPTLTLDGSTKIFQSAWLFKNEFAAGAEFCNDEIRTLWTAAGRPFVAGNMYVGYTLARTECYVQEGGTLYYDLNPNAIVGTKSGSNGTPINTSIIVRKVTGIVGKRFRGRQMLPNTTVAEANISQAGIIDATGLATISSQYDSLYTAWAASDFPPYLGHSVSEVAPTEILSFSINEKVGSQPHRIRGY